MQQAIKDSGYKPADSGVTLRVTGRVVQQREAWALELTEMKRPLTLALTPSREGAGAAGNIGELVGRVVEVEGRWHPAAGSGDPGSLVVGSIKPAASDR